MSKIANDIKSRCNIVDVISQVIPLKKIGDNYKGTCPWHNENTPSFIVSERKQIFTCFGCGKTGDLIEFVKLYYNIEFGQAITKINLDFNLGLTNKKPTIRDKEEIRLNIAINKAYEVYMQGKKDYYRSMTDLYRILWKTSLRCEIEGLSEYLIRLEDWLNNNVGGVKYKFE